MTISANKSLLRSAYQKIPVQLQWLFSPLKLAYRLSQKLRINVWIISGIAAPKTPFTILFAGGEGNKNYIANLAFNSSYTEVYIGRTWLWNLMRIIRKRGKDHSLLVVEMNKAFRRLFDTKGSFFIPSWIGGEVDTSSYTSKRKYAIRSDVSKLEKLNMQYEVTNERHRFERFYTDMYLPYITKVYGNRAFLMPYDEMMDNCENCDLILIKKDGEDIAGILLHYKDNVANLWSVGIKGGNTAYLKDRIIGIIHYVSIHYLKQKGYEKVHFGGSRPFLKDGCLRYKKCRGLQLTGLPRRGLLVKAFAASEGVKNFLLMNPFIYLDQGKLNGAVFVDEERCPSVNTLKDLYEDYYLEGLCQLVIYMFGGGCASISEMVPKELSAKVSVRPAEELFKPAFRREV